jgi:hypothetical protein
LWQTYVQIIDFSHIAAVVRAGRAEHLDRIAVELA